jgi:ATP-dependent DNA helicase RecG
MEGVTLRTLKTAKVSRRRNPLIADLLRRIQYIEAWGRGIPLILDKAPNVRFCQVAGIFITEFPRPSISEEEDLRPESGLESGAQSGAQSARILSLLKNEACSASELANELKLETKTGAFKRAIRELIEANLIEYTLPEKPNSRLQKYRLTPKGHAALQ